MIVALLYDNDNVDNIDSNKKRRKKEKWPRHIKMRHIVPLYKMVNDYH